MSNGLARITNWYCRLTEEGGQTFSEVVIESTSPFPYRIERPGPGTLVLVAEALANAHPDTIIVDDGLVDEVSLTIPRTGEVEAQVKLEADVVWEHRTQNSLPFKTILRFERSILTKIFSHKTIVIDPGHGGADFGYRGPVSLREKQVTLKMATVLNEILRSFGAETFLTRQQDVSLSWQERLNLARQKKAEVFISLHTHWAPDAKINGAAVFYNPIMPQSEGLAREILARITRKGKVTGRGIAPSWSLTELGRIAGLIIEPATISNWVEEGLFRSPDFHRKIAYGIAVGLEKYFAQQEGASYAS
ncbi:MAG: N-acetylmuramoyl-L-alanine amidase [Clostridia bacterium]|nr:N-acetylmuramoyl-L-alanine amidase [Clostridia bacterium]